MSVTFYTTNHFWHHYQKEKEKEKREAFTLLDERLSFLTYFSGESGSRDITR